jgi:hypothetical protein
MPCTVFTRASGIGACVVPVYGQDHNTCLSVCVGPIARYPPMQAYGINIGRTRLGSRAVLCPAWLMYFHLEAEEYKRNIMFSNIPCSGIYAVM